MGRHPLARRIVCRERAHQEGVKEDRRTQGVKGYEAQQTAQFKAEERASNPKVEERGGSETLGGVARTRKRTRTEAVKAETDDKREQMIMMATDGDEDVEMGAGHV